MTQVVRHGGRAKFSNPVDIRAALEEAIGAKEGSETAVLQEGSFEAGSVEAIYSATVAEGSLPEEAPVVKEDLMFLVRQELRGILPHPVTPIRPSVSPSSCVRALEKALGFGRSALYLEVAVSLAMFAASPTGADLATKRVVMGIYSRAGFNTDVDGEDYKTVNRRINASAALFHKLGREAVLNAMHGLREGKAIESLCSYLGGFNFSGINAVLEYAGKPVKKVEPRIEGRASGEHVAEAATTGERIEARRARQPQPAVVVDNTDGTIVFAGKLSIVVPSDATVAEVRVMVAKLSEFADRMEASLGTPEEQRNREMHA